MNYADLTKTIAEDVYETIRLICNIEVNPDVRCRNLEIFFREVGQDIYTIVYDMNAFDFEIEDVLGFGIDDGYYALAKLVSDSVSTGGAQTAKDSVTKWLYDSATQAQFDAFNNALEVGKHPTVDRSSVGSYTCKWCQEHAGHFIEPTAEVFRRHMCCDCKIVTSGYKTRNGLLENYVKLTPEEFSARQSFYATRGAAMRAQNISKES